MNLALQKYFSKTAHASTLAFFRLAFGLMMFFGIARFALNGWIEEFYLKPQFHFTYFGFDWVKPIGELTYLIFVLCAISALCVAIGYKYRLATAVFFASFTYIELMDKTTYLNHYYFVSVVAFVMIFLPANAYFSVDSQRKPKLAYSYIPRWSVDIIKLILGIVYFYAGLAKINSDWLFRAMPLNIWLPKHADFPVIGPVLNSGWLHYAFSWTGMIYDLVIVFLLLYKRTRVAAFILVVVFHVLTRLLFPIGIFPFIMIISTLIFFDSDFHQKALKVIAKPFRVKWSAVENGVEMHESPTVSNRLKIGFLTVFMIVQLVFPFRYLLYPGELFWTEEGFRFSWRVMLMEKAGYAQFIVTDPRTGNRIYVDNRDFLTTFQEKQMSFQPDFILQYAHHLSDFYKKTGIEDPEVRVECYVALNGRLSRRYIDPAVDLSKINDSFAHKSWILPFNDKIYGL